MGYNDLRTRSPKGIRMKMKKTINLYGKGNVLGLDHINSSKVSYNGCIGGIKNTKPK